jgi:hypothetical protein
VDDINGLHSLHPASPPGGVTVEAVGGRALCKRITLSTDKFKMRVLSVWIVWFLLWVAPGAETASVMVLGGPAHVTAPTISSECVSLMRNLRKYDCSLNYSERAAFETNLF